MWDLDAAHRPFSAAVLLRAEEHRSPSVSQKQTTESRFLASLLPQPDTARKLDTVPKSLWTHTAAREPGVHCPGRIRAVPGCLLGSQDLPEHPILDKRPRRSDEPVPKKSLEISARLSCILMGIQMCGTLASGWSQRAGRRIHP